MDPIQPPTQEPVQTPVQIPDFQPKPNYLKTIIFSIMGVLLVVSTIYLYLQNQKLQQQVLNPQVSPTIPAPSPTPKTISSISIPPDETVNWKVYTNTEYFYSFKYPKNLILKNIADGADGSLPTNARMLTLSDPTHPNYEDRFIDIQYFGLLLDLTPKSDWNSTIVKFGDTQATKFISNKPEVKFDVYHVNLKSGGLEIMTNKTQSTIIDQILSTFKFIDDRSVCVPTYQVETNSVELTAEQNYSVRCTEQRSEKDCLSIDLYNQNADDFSIPDGIPDCIWKNTINTI
jgi:hypothetical protein